MFFNEFFAYKTQFFFAKNEIDHMFYMNITNEKIKTNNFDESFINDLLLNNNEYLIEIKTKYGYFIKNNFNSKDYSKFFLTHNSSNFCGKFTSNRVSDTYGFAFAEKGILKRFFSVEDDEVVCEGQKSAYEKGIKHALKLPPEDDISYVDEDDILKIINNCIGFDIETENVEILDIQIYKWTGIIDNVSPNIVFDIYDNLNKQNTNNVSIVFSKNNKLKNILLTASADDKLIYSYIFKKKFSFEEFSNGFHSALFCLAKLDYEKNSTNYNYNIENKTFIGIRFFKNLKLNLDNKITCNFNKKNDKGDLIITLSNIKDKTIDKNLIIHNGDIFENYTTTNDDKLVYKFIKKNINRKNFKKFGKWNLQSK